MCRSRLTLNCDGTRTGKKNWLFCVSLKKHSTQRTQRGSAATKKRVPLFHLPRRGGEKRGLSATGVHGVSSDNERPKDSQAGKDFKHSNEEHERRKDD